MHRFASTLIGFAAAALAGTAAFAADSVKIGLIEPYSGQFADAATQQDDAIKLFMKQNGDTVAGKKIEIIRKDVGGINPPVAKRLAQELVTRDHADILTGFVLTPNAMAAGDISREAKKFMVVMNAATSVVISKSPYMVRTSLTIPQLEYSFGKWAATKGGVKNVYVMVTDYGPGHDAQAWFEKGFKDAGGNVAGQVKMAVANPDFSAYVQRAKDLNPQGIFVMIPGGAQPGAFGKALAERGIDPEKTKVMGQLEITDDSALKSMGNNALGIITVGNYDWNHKSKENEAFVKAYQAEYKRNPDFFAVGAWDGMHAIYAALKKTNGNADGEALTKAAEGMSWESPRGPVSIDPQTRDIVQNVYIRKVEKQDGQLANVDIDTIPAVKDPTHGAK